MIIQNFIRNLIGNFKSRAAHVAAIAGLTAIFAVQGLAAAGDFDASFGVAGRATLPGLIGTTKAVAVQLDGKIVGGGRIEGCPGARRILVAGGGGIPFIAGKTRGDFDGDRRADLAIFRPSNGEWWIARSVDDQTRVAQFGMSGDVPVARDNDGDGKADVAVYRPADNVWYLLRTTNGFAAAQFGADGDIAGN